MERRDRSEPMARSDRQRRGAAVKAHRTRTKKLVASADLAATDVIMDPPVESQDLTISEFLEKNLPGFDRDRSLRLCDRVALKPFIAAGDVPRPLAIKLAAEVEVYVADFRIRSERARGVKPHPSSD